MGDEKTSTRRRRDIPRIKWKMEIKDSLEKKNGNIV